MASQVTRHHRQRRLRVRGLRATGYCKNPLARNKIKSTGIILPREVSPHVCRPRVKEVEAGLESIRWKGKGEMMRANEKGESREVQVTLMFT